jgi:xylitol oxidase
MMDKREFLKVSGGIVAGSLLPRVVRGQEAGGPRENWAGNLTYGTDRLLTPGSVEELQQAIKSNPSLRALGTRHSFSNIADSTKAQISLKRFDQMTIDDAAHTVKVGAGVSYGKLSPYLDDHGYALHNLASLPHISVAGAISTATHGSGIHNGNLATAVAGLEMVRADGDVVSLSRAKDGDKFLGMVVGLGALGVITNTTLNLLPTFKMAQSVYENLSFDHLKDHFDDIFSAGYSVSLFTTWQNHVANQVWIKRKLAPNDKNQWQPEFYGAKLATKKLHPVPGHDAEPCTEQQGIPGPWYERMPHFRMNFTPSSGRELQTEYFVPRERGYEAVMAVEKLRDQITPHLFITELRTIAADELWMSMAYKRPSLAIHFTWKPEGPEVHKILPQIEEALAPFEPRPHWAKVFTIPPAQVQSRYVKLGEFKAELAKHDPTAKFRNEYLRKNLYSA